MSYTRYTNADVRIPTLNQITTGTADQCISTCDTISSCAGVTFKPNILSGINCYLKSATDTVQTLVNEPGYDFYNKKLHLAPIANYSYDSSYESSANYTKLTKYATDNHVDLSSCNSRAISEQPECKIELIQKHMRDNMDRKVAEIYQSHGTNTLTLDENYRNTMMLGVVWAMLGTTVLYYTFKNL